MRKSVFTALLLLYRLLSSSQEIRIQDTHLQATIDEKDGFKSGVLKGVLRLSGSPAAGMKLVVELAALRKEFPVTDSLVSFSLSIPGVKLWSAETPVLYNVQVQLQDSSRRAGEAVIRQVVFRNIVMLDGGWRVNGRAVRMKGIRPYTLDVTRTATVSGEAFLKGLKQYNINAILVPPGAHDDWYALCDQYGFYVVDTVPESGVLRVSGNSLGGFRELWDTIRVQPAHYQGSFVYDTTGGVFLADGKITPAAWEMKKVYQPVLTTLAGTSKMGATGKVTATVQTTGVAGIAIRVFNDFFFRDLSNLSLEWEVLLNGVPGQRGVVPVLNVGAQQSGVIRLPVRMPAGPGEVLLNIFYRLKKAEPLMSAGQRIAFEQLALREAFINDVTVRPAGELSLKDEGSIFTVSSAATGLDMQFNKQTGWLQHYIFNGHVLLDEEQGLTANFWRAPTDRDYAEHLPLELSAWKHSTREPKLQLFSTSTSTDFVVVRADYLLPETRCALHVRYTINARGEMQVEEALETDSTQTGTAGEPAFKSPMLPRMGMKWMLPAGFDSVAYYGRGPQENYTDRHTGVSAGIYRQTVEEQYFPYARPQECGTRTGVRWYKVTDRQGHGLMITADSSLLGISALHYYDSDLDDGDEPQQRHAGELKPHAGTQLNIDLRQMGLAGDRLPYGNYRYLYKIAPF